MLRSAGRREFHDPLPHQAGAPQVEKYGMQGGPARTGGPECKLNDDAFQPRRSSTSTAGPALGPNVQRLACIKKHLRSQGIAMDELPAHR